MPVQARTQASRWAVAVLLALSASANAAVTAQVDRNRIDLNESFLLEIVANPDVDAEPDTSVLQQDFIVGPASELRNATIVNNQISRSRTWKYPLMARRAGQLEIPPITVGTEQTARLQISVREPVNAPPGEADVFITSEVDYAETYVQAQVLYRIKIYRAAPTRQPALRDPVFGGAEVLIENSGDDRSYDARLDDKTYQVLERVYAVFPQESGDVTISPARFEARVLRDGRITGRKVFESEPQTIKVLPMPAPPDDFPTAAWLPARDLQLTESWSREPGELAAGEPITRNITISALGQLETQIPVTPPPVVDGVNIYPDRPELSRRLEPGGIRGIRKDQYAMIGAESGEMRLPPLELPWWDVEAGEWRVASLPERTITVLPGGEPAVPDPVVSSAPANTEGGDTTPVVTAPSGLWQRAALGLAALWLLTVLAWRWSVRPRREPREPPPMPLHKQQAKYLKAARKAALAEDGAGVRRAMLDWARLQWPENPPRSIGTLARRVSSPLADELQRLSDAAYGPDGSGWDGKALAKSLRSFAALDAEDKQTSDDPLPPLMPQT